MAGDASIYADSGAHPESTSSSGSDASASSSPSHERGPGAIWVTTTTTVVVEEAREGDIRPFGLSTMISGPYGPAYAEAAAAPATLRRPAAANVIPWHLTDNLAVQPPRRESVSTEDHNRGNARYSRAITVEPTGGNSRMATIRLDPAFLESIRSNDSHAAGITRVVRGENGVINHINIPTNDNTSTARNTPTALDSGINNITPGAAAILRRSARTGRIPRIVNRALARVPTIINSLRTARMASQVPVQGSSYRDGAAARPPTTIAPQRFMEVTQADDSQHIRPASIASTASTGSMPTEHDIALARLNEGPIAHANNQLVPTGALPEQTSDELVALINSGTWDVSAGGDGSSQNHTQRTRPGRTIASAFESRSRGSGNDRDGIRGLRGGRSNTQHTPPASVIEQNEVDAQHLATVNRRVPPPAWLSAALLRNQNPSVDNLVKDMPFFDPNTNYRLPVFGVIRILEPPYHVTKGEIINLLGRQAQIKPQPIGTPYYAIHIMMDRGTGKTEDVFVEVSSVEEAITISNNFARRQREGRPLSLGRHTARVVLSSMLDLMMAVFPRAKNVTWHGALPIVDFTTVEYTAGVPAAPFDGFIGDDETALLIKWLTEPSRSPFASRGPNRLYENVITLLHKYPTHVPFLIYIKDRKRLYDIAFEAIKSLSTILREEQVPAEARLDMRLLQEVVVAALSFPIFTDAQKSLMVAELRRNGQDYQLIHSHGLPVALGGVHDLASRWPFLALVRQPGVVDNVVKYYCKLIRQQSLKTLHGMTAAEISALASSLQSGHADEYFTAFRVDYGVSDEELGKMDMVTCANKEYDTLKQLLTDAITKDT